MSSAALTSPLKESFSVDVRSLRESSGSGWIKELSDGRYRVRCKGQHCGIVNRNNRLYPANETWGRHTSGNSSFMKRVKARRVTGQLEHPVDGKSSMGLAAVCITEVAPPDPKTGEVWIVFETMSTEPGRIVEAYIRDGVGFGISSRGNGSVVKRQDGVDEVQGDFEPITFDCVIDESTPGSEVPSRMLREGIACLDRTCAALLESAGGDEDKARVLAAEQTAVALRRDSLSGEDCGCSRNIAEGYEVESSVPYSGTMLMLAFDSDGEAKQAAAALSSAGFNVSRKGSAGVCVYTSYEDSLQAEAHIVRVLGNKKIEPKDESFEDNGRIVREDQMSTSRILEEINSKLDALSDVDEALPGVHYGRKKRRRLGRREDYDDMDEFEDDDDEDMDEFGDDYEDELDDELEFFEDDDEDDEDDEDDDEKDEDYEPYDFGFDLPEEVDSYIVVPNVDESVGDSVVFLDEDGEVVGVLDERPVNRGAMKAMFAKANARDDVKATAKSGKASTARGTEKGAKYYRKFRKKAAKKNNQDQKAAGAGYGRFKKGRKVRGGSLKQRIAKGARMSKRPVKHRNESVLDERPVNRGAMKAMFAKANARDDVKATAKSGKASTARGTEKGAKYYRKFRKKAAKKNNQDQKAAGAGYGRFKKGRKVRGGSLKQRIAKGARMSKRPVKHRNESRIIEAAATLLGSSYEGDILSAVKLVLERASEWSPGARAYLLAALNEAHAAIGEADLCHLVESAKDYVESSLAEDNYYDEDDEQEFFYDEDDRYGELESENARLSELVSALSELNTAQAVEHKVAAVCADNPVLEKVREKLLDCDTVEGVVEEADAYLSVVSESTTTRVGSAHKVSVPSQTDNSSALPEANLSEGMVPSIRVNKDKSVGSTSSRVASYRRRQRNQRG